MKPCHVALSPNRPLQIRLYHTVDHQCGYYPDRTARNLIVDPDLSAPTHIYEALVAQGFRRSGSEIFRPDCQQCKACVAARIPVDAFTPRRKHRRNLSTNSDLHVVVQPTRFSNTHFDLYKRYLQARHNEGGMDKPTQDDYRRFLYASWSKSVFIEAYQGVNLVAVAVTDVLPDGLSAVYTFYEPALLHRGLGTFAILKQIELARDHGLKHVYLGYWIRNHPKMDYKSAFQPLELYQAGHWKR